MKKLEALSLEHNFLSALPITLEFCQNLTALNLMNNNFTSVPDIVLRLRDLTELRHSCKDPADLWDISVKAMPLEQPACIEKNVGLLQSLCMAAVFEKHVDYLRQEAGCPTQIQAALDYLASRIIICHMCSKVVSHGKVTLLVVCLCPIININPRTYCEGYTFLHWAEKYPICTTSMQFEVSARSSYPLQRSECGWIVPECIKEQHGPK